MVGLRVELGLRRGVRLGLHVTVPGAVAMAEAVGVHGLSGVACDWCATPTPGKGS
ncbi:hypothetical protein GCM10022245_72850 [Streptomyces mayteni]